MIWFDNFLLFWYILLYWIFLWYYMIIWYDHVLHRIVLYSMNILYHVVISLYIYTVQYIYICIFTYGVYIQSYTHFVFIYRYTVRYLNIYIYVSLVYPSIHEPPYPSTHPMAYATLIQSKQPPMRWCLRLWGSSDCETGWADRPSAAYCRAARKGLGGSSSSRKVVFSLNIYV